MHLWYFFENSHDQNLCINLVFYYVRKTHAFIGEKGLRENRNRCTKSVFFLCFLSRLQFESEF